MTPLRVAVVGLGYWGPNLVRNFHELDSVEVVAVCDARADLNTRSTTWLGSRLQPQRPTA